jgi:hypothetical protein
MEREMTLQKTLATLLMVLMTSPAWCASDPVGNITSSTGGSVRNTALNTGSTVFSGDEISVGERGAVQIALGKGAQAEVLGGSLVRMIKESGKIQMTVDRGQASFRAPGNSAIEGLVADATVRPADTNDASAIIQSLSPTHAVIASQKGNLLITTASNGKTYTVREGEAVDLTADASPQQNGGAIPAGKSAPRVGGGISAHKQVIWTVVIVGSAAAITAYLLARREPANSNTSLGNEISPTKLN